MTIRPYMCSCYWDYVNSGTIYWRSIWLYAKMAAKLHQPKKWPHHEKEHVKGFAPCKRIHEGPGFRIPASPSIWILDSNPLDSGFQPSGFRIPYQSGGNHCGFQQQKLAGFRIPDSGFSYMGRKVATLSQLSSRADLAPDQTHTEW